ncbi:MAG: prepilin peptidase [Cyanobacteria bacterium P01_A01_bin.37]
MSVLVFILGASIGSFLNVVIYRLPAGLSLVHPPSRCPRCEHRLKPYDNVPIIGWLWLKGRCRYCRTAIAPRYPLVEAATGLLFLVTFWSFDSLPTVFGMWVFLSWLLALSLIDIDTLTLPSQLTKSGLVLGALFQGTLGWLDGQLSGAVLYVFGSVIGMVLGLWLFDLITILGSAVFGQTAMGGGDAKLAAMMGAWLGWKYLLLASFLACFLGALIGGGAMVFGRMKRRQQMPFGPYLALGAAITVFWGEAIIATYLSLYFPP